MHGKAKFGHQEGIFADLEAEIMVIQGENPGKRANSAAERGICAYEIDFFVFLYAF